MSHGGTEPGLNKFNRLQARSNRLLVVNLGACRDGLKTHPAAMMSLLGSCVLDVCIQNTNYQQNRPLPIGGTLLFQPN